VKQGVTRIVLAVGYKWEVIRDYFGNDYRGVPLEYSVEYEPLLTGGAIRQALSKCKENGVFVLNGDTYFDVDLKALRTFAEKTCADLVLAGKVMTDFQRYGTMEVDATGKVLAFVEKQHCAKGIINGGIYYLHRDFFRGIEEKAFSFEEQVLKRQVSEGKMYTCLFDEYFIDIGIPEDYQKAQVDFRT